MHSKKYTGRHAHVNPIFRDLLDTVASPGDMTEGELARHLRNRPDQRAAYRAHLQREAMKEYCPICDGHREDCDTCPECGEHEEDCMCVPELPPDVRGV